MMSGDDHIYQISYEDIQNVHVARTLVTIEIFLIKLVEHRPNQ
jgi:hypothetical protein